MSLVASSSSAKARSPLSVRVRDQVQHSFQGSAAGEKLPSERQLARELGVSTITISRVLQELQSEGMIERIPGKGTFWRDDSTTRSFMVDEAVKAFDAPKPQGASRNGLPGRQARPQTTSPESHIEIQTERPLPFTWIIADLGAPQVQDAREFWPHRITSSLERAIQQAGGRTVVCNRAAFNAALIREEAARRLEEGINSVVYVGDAPGEEGELWMRQLLGFVQRRATEQPTGVALSPTCVTLVQFSGDNSGPFDTVRFDGEWGSFLATRHLLEFGHRDLLFLSSAPQQGWMKERVRGFRRALSLVRDDVGLAENGAEELMQMPLAQGRNPHDWILIGRDAGEEFLRDPRAARVSGVVALNDEMAVGFLQRLRELDTVTATRLSVVGFDDWVGSQAVGLSTVHPPIELMGQHAAQLILRRLAEPGAKARSEEVLEPVFVARSSSRRFENKENSS